MQHMEMEHDINEKGGALVEEAKRLMKGDEEEEDAPQQAENAGPKIKMNKIGGKKKKGADAAKTGAGAAKPYGVAAESKGAMWNATASKSLA